MNPFELLVSRLAKPGQLAVLNAGLKNLDDISNLTELEFSNLHGIGKNALNIVRASLNEYKLQFKAE